MDADNQPVETLVPFCSIRDQLTKDGDRWIVTTADTTFLQKGGRTSSVSRPTSVHQREVDG